MCNSAGLHFLCESWRDGWFYIETADANTACLVAHPGDSARPVDRPEALFGTWNKPQALF